MPRISGKESNARRTEIIDACEALYQHTSYRDITMAQIAGEPRRCTLFIFLICRML